MSRGTDTNSEKINDGGENETVNQMSAARTTFRQASPPPSYYPPPVENTGSPPQAVINSHQTTQQSGCRQVSRSETDAAYVKKFSRICAPICQIMSIGLSMYFFNFLKVMYIIHTNPAYLVNTSSYFIGELMLLVIGLFSLISLYPAFKKNSPCMLTPYITFQYGTNILVIFGVIGNMFFARMWNLVGILFVTFFIAFLCLSNYTLCQVMRLRKVMCAERSRVPNGGVPVYFASTAEGMRAPPYPGVILPLSSPTPKNDGWTLNARSA